MASSGLALLLASPTGAAWAGTDSAPVERRISAQPESLQDRETDVPTSDRWWRIFGIAELDPLISRVHAGNKDIAQAKARLAIARAAVKSGEAAQLPSLGTGTAGSYASGPLINDVGGSGSLLNVGVSTSWDLDLFGVQTGNRRALREDASAADAELQATILLLEAVTVDSWFRRNSFAVAALQADRIVTLKAERLNIITRRMDRGQAVLADVDSAQRDLDNARTVQAQFALLCDQADRQLTHLTGENDAHHVASPFQPTTNAPNLPTIPADVSADILTRRPDLRAAQLRVRAADDRLTSQRKGWLPVLSLTGSGGVASTSLGALLSKAATGFGLAGLLAIPLFDGGRNQAAIEQRSAERDFARSSYEDQVLRALRDVNDRLQELENRKQILARTAKSAETGDRLYQIANTRLRIGTIGRLDQIDAELEATQRHLAQTQAQAQALLATTNVILALGGGWASNWGGPAPLGQH